MENLFPDLCKSDELPELMRKKVESDTLFYKYDEHSIEEWEEAWTDFTHDIREVSAKYEKRIKL